MSGVRGAREFQTLSPSQGEGQGEGGAGTMRPMWVLLALAAALFQVLRNTAMKRLGHALDEYINVWGRFTFLLPFALAMAMIKGFPPIKPGFVWACLAFGLCQNLATLALSKALKLAASECS